MTPASLSHAAALLNLPPLPVIVGRTAAMESIVYQLQRVAESNVPVLLQGESGTGKEVLVRLLHAFSGGPVDSLIKVNCIAIPEGLLETELFGYERGAFTGASASKPGRLEQADKGTLFLDEVDSLEVTVQAKLLQVLEDGSFVRVGGQERRTIHIRLASTASSNLRDKVHREIFRKDFLFRINGLTLNVPSLRHRIQDLPMLADHFLETYARAFRQAPRTLSRNTLQWMMAYAWPGNIRQLENLVRNYALIGSEEALIAELAPHAPVGDLVTEIDLHAPVSMKRITKKATQALERQIIVRALAQNHWDRRQTASWLNISYRSLLNKLAESGLTHGEQLHAAAPGSDKQSPSYPVSPSLVSRTKIL
jgi:two-component system response regulator AtoC